MRITYFRPFALVPLRTFLRIAWHLDIWLRFRTFMFRYLPLCSVNMFNCTKHSSRMSTSGTFAVTFRPIGGYPTVNVDNNKTFINHINVWEYYYTWEDNQIHYKNAILEVIYHFHYRIYHRPRSMSRRLGK